MRLVYRGENETARLVVSVVVESSRDTVHVPRVLEVPVNDGVMLLRADQLRDTMLGTPGLAERLDAGLAEMEKGETITLAELDAIEHDEGSAKR